MSELNDIGLKYGTDKSTITHCYLDTYEKYFESWKDKEFVMWELGVAAGASIRMWRDYFPNAKVFGIDNNPDCAGYVDGVFIGDQADVNFLQNMLDNTGVPDIILDDGAHTLISIDSFKYLFPKMKSDGIYIIEDFHTAYSTHYSGEFEQNGRTRLYNFFTDLAAHVDVCGRAMTGDAQYAIDWPIQEPPVPEYSRLLKAIHIYPSLRILFRK